jgi:hypothetical protein
VAAVAVDANAAGDAAFEAHRVDRKFMPLALKIDAMPPPSWRASRTDAASRAAASRLQPSHSTSCIACSIIIERNIAPIWAIGDLNWLANIMPTIGII